MSTAVQLGFPDAVSRILKAQPRAYAKPQYVEYNDPQNRGNILYGRGEFSDFHDNARAELLQQLENKKRDAESREKRFLMGNPLPKLPMNSWSSAGRPSVSADKTITMGDYGMRGGTQPNYTPEALEIQRKMLKRRANEAGILSRNEMPPPTMKPKKTFAESLADVINTVLLSLEDAVGSGNYSSINAGDIYKLFRTFAENGFVFESNQLIRFKENIDGMIEDLEGVASARVPTPDQKGAKLLLNAFGRVSNLISSLLKNAGLGMEQRKRASQRFVEQIKKELPPLYRNEGEQAYRSMMDAVYAEMEEDRGTTIPRNFDELNADLPMDVYREGDERTFDPYDVESEGAETSSSVRRMIESDMDNFRFQEAVERGDFAPSESSIGRSFVMPPAPPPSVADLVQFPRSAVPRSQSVVPPTAPQQRIINGVAIPPTRADLPNDLTALQNFARSIGYGFDPATSKGNLKRGILAKIRKVYPTY
jgi:hypothetical protein